jgi:tetratricopeptide (TPR) repeat protein
MTYRVALDDKSKDEKGAMASTWMDAADQHGIPTAFVVNKEGRIAWIGHPMTMKEQLWDDVLNNRYDMAKAIADYEKAQETQKQMSELSRRLNTAMRDKQWGDAEAALKEIEKANPESSLNVQAMRFEILLQQKDYDKAYAMAKSISEAHPDVAPLQNRLAWTLVARPGLEKRDTALAETIALRANKAAGEKDPAILDTLARAQFMNGKKEEAAATEKKAMDLADAEQQSEYKKTLQSYQSGKLPDAED